LIIRPKDGGSEQREYKSNPDQNGDCFDWHDDSSVYGNIINHARPRALMRIKQAALRAALIVAPIPNGLSRR